MTQRYSVYSLVVVCMSGAIGCDNPQRYTSLSGGLYEQYPQRRYVERVPVPPPRWATAEDRMSSAEEGRRERGYVEANTRGLASSGGNSVNPTPYENWRTQLDLRDARAVPTSARNIVNYPASGARRTAADPKSTTLAQGSNAVPPAVSGAIGAASSSAAKGVTGDSRDNGLGLSLDRQRSGATPNSTRDQLRNLRDKLKPAQ